MIYFQFQVVHNVYNVCMLHNILTGYRKHTAADLHNK